MNDSSSRIVVGVDGSDHSIIALRQAAEIAQALGCTVHAICTWQYPAMGAEFVQIDWSPEEDAKAILADAATAAYGDTPPEGFSTEAIRGTPASVLIDVSKDARMLVVGSRGHGGFSGLLLGSVSQAVIAHAECPVLVAR